MLLGALQKRPQLRSEAELEEEARHLSAQAKTQAMKGGRAPTDTGSMRLQRHSEAAMHGDTCSGYHGSQARWLLV